MGKWALLAPLVCAALGACGRWGFNDSSSPDGAAPDLSIHVSIPMDRMAGPDTIASIDDLPAGTVGVSVREALTIAKNHAGPDRVVFDPLEFPQSAPVTLALDSTLVVDDAETTLDGTDAGVTLTPGPALVGPVLAITGDSATLVGFSIQGGDQGITAMGRAGVTIRQVAIRQPINEAIDLVGCSQALIEDSRVDGAGAMPIHLNTSMDSTVRRTFVALANKTGSNYGIRVESSTRMHLVDNVIDPGSAWMIDLESTTDSEVAGNILDGSDTGVTVFGASSGNVITRNVMLKDVYHAVYLDTPVTNTTVINNTSYLCGGGTFVDAGTGNMLANNLDSLATTDFVNPAAYDFHLAPGSPSIDAATDLGQDMLPDDPARFLGAGPDLGAVESY